MAKKENKVPSNSSAPEYYLTTDELESQLHLTRRILRRYSEKSVVHPVHSVKGGSDLWDPGDAKTISYAAQLRNGEYALDEIAVMIKESPDSFNAAVYETTLAQARDSRRMLKVMVHEEHQKALTKHIEQFSAGQLYVRYIPERWMTIIPSLSRDILLPRTRAYSDAMRPLRLVSESIGWCVTWQQGCVYSYGIDGQRKQWANLVLASPPMPVSTGMMIVDGGCYAVVDKNATPKECLSHMRCSECARFGRKPKGFEIMQLYDCPDEMYRDVIYANELTRPYLTGIWSDYTYAKIEQNSHSNDLFASWNKRHVDTSAAARKVSAGNTVRPRIMPQEARLPQGISACSIPAETYVCIKVKYAEISDAVERLVDIAHSMDVVQMNEQIEIELSQVSIDENDESRPKGPFFEPFAEPRMVGDGKYMGKARAVYADDLVAAMRYGGIGLRAQDDFVITCEELPQLDGAQEPHFEVQLLCHGAKKFLD